MEIIERQQLTAYKGQAGWIKFPKTWLETFDMSKGFWEYEGYGYINFGSHGAFKIDKNSAEKVSKEDQKQIPWGSLCWPWETYQTGVMFGVASKDTSLDKL